MTVLISFEDGSDGYLEHYGVLGMKWGVRRGRSGTGRKVADQVSRNREKANTLRAKAYKKDRTAGGRSKTAKYAKYQAKQVRYRRKQEKAASKAGPDNPNASMKAAKYGTKAAKYERKAKGYSSSVAKVAKLNAKASKLEFKADRLEKAYNKQIAKLDARDRKRGKDAVDAVLPKWKENGYSSEKDHKEAIARASKMLNDKYGGKTVSTYYK